MKRLHKEPLLHFVLLGALIFAVNAWREPRRDDEAKSKAEIKITAGVVERLSAGYERQFGRLPDEEELRGLVTAHIREEVLYREAMALGLERDDTIVRRRLAQKMEFLTDDVTGVAEPDDALLRQFFAQNAARYAKPARTSFRHVYFSKEKRGANTDAAARDALAALRAGASDEMMGDTFLHGFEFPEQEPEQIAALFGAGFAAQLATGPAGEWSGPFASSYGVHVVRVEVRGEARTTAFEEVRAAVLRDFAEERRRTTNREVFERLRARYHVAVDEEALKKTAQPRMVQR